MKQTFDRHMTILFDKPSQSVAASLANAGFQNRGVCLQGFPSFPSPFPPPLSFFGSHFISRAAKTGLSLLRNKMKTLATLAIEANEITDPGKRRSIFLVCVGAKTYKLVPSLVVPKDLKDKSHED